MRSFLPPFVTALAALSLGAAEHWHHQDPESGGSLGVRSAKVWQEWGFDEQLPPVLVAVLDSGCDDEHPDLTPRLWANPAEQTGAADTDDDANGLVDDVHGWNFLGDLTHGSRVLTRELLRLEAMEQTLDEAGKRRLDAVRLRYEQELARAQRNYIGPSSQLALWEKGVASLRALGWDGEDAAALAALEVTDPELKALHTWLKGSWARREQLAAAVAEARAALTHWYHQDFRDSTAIGDDPTDLTQYRYGDARIDLGDIFHGTHVAGIIGADHAAGTPVKGVCPRVHLITVRCVPNGDERDKDVANGIRYAVDAGAKVINLSFGKEYADSPEGKQAVDDAGRYARDKDVLIVQGAGNDGKDLDRTESFPNPVLATPLPGEDPVLPNWILVGASGSKEGKDLAANWSNYGETRVHLFAPGVDIVSCVPGGAAGPADGTSMASPVAAGVAALVRQQFPRLSAAEVKAILCDSSRKLPKAQTNKPGGNGPKVPFSTLSSSGGIVDAWAALELARERAATTTVTP